MWAGPGGIRAAWSERSSPGWVISLWGVYLFILNVRENMKLSTGAAAAVVLIPFVIVLGLVLLVVLVLAAAFFGST